MQKEFEIAILQFYSDLLISERKTLKEADVDKDGHINFLEFANINENACKERKLENGACPLEPAKPPDGGWGWVVVFSCFMCNFIVEGFGYNFGIILKPLKTHFDSSKASVAFVGSLLSGVNAMVAPIFGALVNKFGMRTICIAGSIIGCIGLSVSSLSTSVPHLMLTMGVIAGIGAGAITLPANIAVGYYFERKRALATGISQTGSGVGQFVFAPIVTILLNNYGWETAVWVVAGLYIMCVVFGALLRPLEVKAGAEEECPSAFLCCGTKSDEEVQEISPFSRRDLFFSGTPNTLMKANSLTQGEVSSSWEEFRHLLFNLPSSQLGNIDEKKGIWNMMKGLINMKLLVEPTFLLVALSGFTSMLGFFVPLFYLPNMAELNGVTNGNANFLLSIYAASNIPGKLLTGWLSDQNWVDVFSFYNAYIMLCGITVFFFPFCNSYGLYGFVVALYGLFTTFFILKTIVLVEIVGIENLTSAFSLLNLFEGIATLIGPTICGLIFDFAGSYDKSFYVAGAFFLVSGSFSHVAKLWHRKKFNEKQNREGEF